MEAHSTPDLERASSEGQSNVPLNDFIRAEVRAAVQAEVTATMATSAPPAYDPSSSAIISASPITSSSLSEGKNTVTNNTLPAPTPAQVPQRPLGFYRISLALVPWLIIFSLLPTLSLTADKHGIATLTFFLVIISIAVLFTVTMFLTCAFPDSWGSSEKLVNPENVKRSNFNVVIMISWYSLICCALFGYLIYWQFFQKKSAVGAVAAETEAFERLLGVDGAMGILVTCLKGRTGSGNSTMGDLGVCFRGLGING